MVGVGVEWRAADRISLFVVHCGKNNPLGHLVPGSQSHGTTIKTDPKQTTSLNIHILKALRVIVA